MRRLSPCHDYVVLRPVAVTDHLTESGLVIPEIAREKPTEGDILALGWDANLSARMAWPVEGPAPRAIKVGDRVIYAKYAGTEYELNGETVILVKAADLIALVEDTPTGGVDQPAPTQPQDTP